MRPARAETRQAFAAPMVGLLLLVSVVLAGCAADAPSEPAAGGAPSGTVTLYTSYNQPEVDALLAAYDKVEPKVTVEVFRAPTGQLSARIAAEQRSGGVRGDVLLLSDPLSMQQYAAQGMLRRWSPPRSRRCRLTPAPTRSGG